MSSSRFFCFAVLAAAFVLSGCGQSNLGDASEFAAEQATESQNSGAFASLAADSTAAKAGSLLALASMSAVLPDRYLIKNATVILETGNPEDVANDLTNAVSGAGGYVGDLNESTDGLGRRSVALTIRVPAERFDDIMVNLSSLGKVLHKQISAQDITEEYVDTEARSRNLKLSEERIIDHLGRAGTLEDILRVESELTRVRQQIEQLDGRIRFLSDRVAFSTLNVTVREKPAVESMLPAETFSAGQTLSQATRSLAALGQSLLVVVIWVIVYSPVWIVIGLLAFTLRRRYLRNVAA